MGNKNNRFLNPTMASKNRIQPPSKVMTVVKHLNLDIQRCTVTSGSQLSTVHYTLMSLLFLVLILMKFNSARSVEEEMKLCC